MPYVYAGEWGVEAIAQGVTISGTANILQALPGTAVTVKDSTNTNLITIYTDRTKASTKANPTTTDSLGNLSIFADPGSYQVTIGTNVPFKIDIFPDPAEIVAGFDVLAFGAKGDGVTDDRAAFVATINAAQTAPGGQVLIPPGTYLFSSAIDLTGKNDLAFIGSPGVNLGGAGSVMGTTKLTANGAFEVFTVNGQGTTNAYTYRLRFENLTFVSGLRCISFQNVVDCTFVNCGFFPNSNAGADNVGVRIVNSFLIWFRTCTWNAAATTGKISVILRGAQPAFDVTSVYLVYFLDCTFWYGGVLYDHAATTSPVAKHFVFQRCLTENFNTTQLLDVSRSNTGAFTMSGLEIVDTEMADIVGYCPLVHVHSPVDLSGPTIQNCNSLDTIQVDSGATLEGAFLASPRAGTSQSGIPTTASGGNPTGNAVTMLGQSGWGVISDAATWTNMLIAPDRGNLLAGILSGDTNARFLLNLDGTHRWGPGGSTATADVTFGRTGAAALNVTGVNQTFTLDGSTGASVVILKSTTGSQVSMIRAGEAQARTLHSESSLQFGPGGSTAPDVKLTRNGISQLQFSDGMFLDVGAATGITIGLNSSQKLAFYGATPALQPAVGQSPRQVLTTLGLIASTGQLSEPTSATVATNETTTSTTYADLTTTTDQVTVTTGSKALVTLTADLANNTSLTTTLVGFAVSGTTVIAANDAQAIQSTPAAANAGNQMTATYLVTGLNPGSNTFKMKYRVAGGTGSFLNRNIVVVPV